MNQNTLYLPKYQNSWAFIIGINQYDKCKPLGYATQDAEIFADTLTTQFGFPVENVTLLKDKEATRERIMETYLKYANEKRVSPDDKIIFFYAGHGHTETGKRGEIGYLVPVNGEPGNRASLIRWDELTRNADLIPAKHMLFIMDACYGGLAITRALSPGSMRFLKDMLQRYSRQVLTAGKANEVVADSGGTRPGHSIFTSHLIDALEGNAISAEGVLTANGVMAYVYDRVSMDQYSKQSPHYGFVDGDGDFIFSGMPVEDTEHALGVSKGKDVLISVPPAFSAQTELVTMEKSNDKVKRLLSEPKYRIELDDFVTTETRKILQKLGVDNFPTHGMVVSNEIFVQRLKEYEVVLESFTGMLILLGKWASREQRSTLEKILTRLPEANTERDGITFLLGFRWYPLLVLIYLGGIAALSVGNYENLKIILTAKVNSRKGNDTAQDIISVIVDNLMHISLDDQFKNLPGHERHYVPRSEYMFTSMQPILEDTLFLGAGYEHLFDRFELLLSLTYADINEEHAGRVWGPLGRFGWKYHSRSRGDNTFNELMAEAVRYGDKWPLLRAGFFQGSIERFNHIAKRYKEELLQKLPWF